MDLLFQVAILIFQVVQVVNLLFLVENLLLLTVNLSAKIVYVYLLLQDVQLAKTKLKIKPT